MYYDHMDIEYDLIWRSSLWTSNLDEDTCAHDDGDLALLRQLWPMTMQNCKVITIHLIFWFFFFPVKLLNFWFICYYPQYWLKLINTPFVKTQNLRG